MSRPGVSQNLNNANLIMAIAVSLVTGYTNIDAGKVTENDIQQFVLLQGCANAEGITNKLIEKIKTVMDLVESAQTMDRKDSSKNAFIRNFLPHVVLHNLYD